MPAAKPQSDGAASARRLSTLLEVSQALSGTLNLKAAMQRVLGTLIRHHSVVRGMVTLLRDGELHVEAVEGFDDRARSARRSTPTSSPTATCAATCSTIGGGSASTWRRSSMVSRSRIAAV